MEIDLFFRFKFCNADNMLFKPDSSIKFSLRFKLRLERLVSFTNATNIWFTPDSPI